MKETEIKNQKKLPNPLLKFIQTKKGIYIYSGHTNEILRITEAMADILESFKRESKTEIFKKLRKKYNPSTLKEGMEIIETFHRDYNYFSQGILNCRVRRKTDREEYKRALIKRSDMTESENIFLEHFIGKSFLRFYKRPIKNKVDDSINVSAMCFPGKQKPFVSTDGKIHVCEKVNPTAPIGNVWDGFDVPEITRLWNQYADIMNEKDCRSCWAVLLCSVCFRTLLVDGKLDSEKKLSECKKIQESSLELLKDYCSIQEKNPNAFDFMEKYSSRRYKRGKRNHVLFL